MPSLAAAGARHASRAAPTGNLVDHHFAASGKVRSWRVAGRGAVDDQDVMLLRCA
jgi:hypothetical protein